MSNNHFAENLRQLTGYGKSVSDICRKAKVNRTQFNRYLSGQSLPSLQTLRRLCDFFGVDEQEILLAPDAFRQIIRLRPPQLTHSEDPAIDFALKLFADQKESAALQGYYHVYFQPEPNVPHIYCNLAKLTWTGRGLLIKIIERHPQDAINLPKRLKYEGMAFVRTGKLFCLVQETRLRSSTLFIALSLGDFDQPQLLNGVTSGTEPEGGNQITSFKSVWSFIGKQPDLRNALHQCGCFEASEIDLSPAIRAGIV